MEDNLDHIGLEYLLRKSILQFESTNPFQSYSLIFPRGISSILKLIIFPLVFHSYYIDEHISKIALENYTNGVINDSTFHIYESYTKQQKKIEFILLAICNFIRYSHHNRFSKLNVEERYVLPLRIYKPGLCQSR